MKGEIAFIAIVSIMNPLEMMKMKNKMTEFTNRHPMLPKFFNRAAMEIKEDTVIDLVITPKDGTPIKTNIKVTKEDLEYIKGFHLIYTNLNSYIEKELPVLYQTGVPVAYDFSTRWTDEYLKEICPYVTVAIMSCAHLTDEEREKEMRKAQSYGVKVVLGTIGEDGSYVLYNDKILYAPAVHADDVIDTMGAGDSYFSAFLCSLLETSKEGKIVEGTDEEMAKRLQTAMGKGAVFAAKVCALEGAFGYGVPILGKTTV